MPVNEARANTLITVDELARLIDAQVDAQVDAQAAVVLLDVIDEQGAAPEGRPKIPGSLCAHLATDFSGTPTAASGRRPLPDLRELQAKARAWGICNDSVVVVYDNSGGAQASRAWWTLRWAGLSNVRVLDGGYGAWAASDRPSSNHVATCASCVGDVVLRAGCMPTIGADEAAKLARQSRLLDARPRASYLGDPAKAGTGHIPGAVHAPAGDNIADGKFKPSDALHARYSGLGAQESSPHGSTPIAVYCGSGNAAAHAIAAMSAAGLAAALYVGSWSEWSADPSRPVATGPT
jgi:thiosulfate/3-mercaptopyruvate sulfurtransferase